MMRIIITILILSNTTFGQTLNRIEKDFNIDTYYKSENTLKSYKSFDFDFSNVWTKTKNHNILGIIGDDHQRIHIKLISVFRISNNPFLYTVYGKSKVKNTICEFYGNIVLEEVKEVNKLHFGVDDEYADKGLKGQGILIADYEFYESKEQNHSGIFKGKLYSKWYLNSENQIEYDDIEFISDGYANNAFVGTWKSYTTESEKLCNWADYRVPLTHIDFDIGAGEFSPNEKYYEKGWGNYQKAWLYGNEIAKKKELNEWWK